MYRYFDVTIAVINCQYKNSQKFTRLNKKFNLISTHFHNIYFL
jgi:hypothetical protein